MSSHQRPLGLWPPPTCNGDDCSAIKPRLLFSADRLDNEAAPPIFTAGEKVLSPTYSSRLESRARDEKSCGGGLV